MRPIHTPFAILTLAAALAACKKEEPTPTDTDTTEDCTDGEPSSTFEGDVGEADVATFCDDVCARDVQGSVVLDATGLANLDDLWCLTAISGDLYIRSNAELTSLSGLSGLRTVGGNVSLGEAYCGFDGAAFACFENYGNPALTSFDGLQNLETIAGWLWLADNDAMVDGGSFDSLTSIGGAHPDAMDGLLVNGNANLVHLPDFPKLTIITGQVEITVNDSLVDVDGLHALVTHAGWFDPYWFNIGFFGIAANPALTSLEGFSNLETIGGNFLVQLLPSWEGLHNVETIGGYADIWGTPFTDLSALRSLRSVGGWLNLINNDQLTDFSGLENLESVGMGINIADNANLESLDGLESMRTIGGSLQIAGLYEDANPALVDVTALYGLESVAEDVIITGNTALTDAAAQALVDEIESIGGTVTISGNE
jgi:hypothetical protein